MNTLTTNPSDNLLENGIHYFLKKEFDKALESVQLFLKKNPKKKGEDFAAAQLLLGKIFLHQQKYIDTIIPLLKAKEAGLRTATNAITAPANLYIGILYSRVFHYPRALSYLRLTKDEQWDDLAQNDQVLLLNYLGMTLFRLGEHDQAESYFEQAVKLIEKNVEHKKMAAFSFAYLGKIYSSRKKFKAALAFAKRAHDIIEKYGDVEGIQVNLINLGNVHCQLEKYNEGIKLASRGIAAAKRLKDGFHEIRGYQIMAEIFRKKKDYKNAVMYQLIYTKFYEDFYQRNDRQKISELESEFTIEQLKEEIETLKQQQQ